MKTKIKTVAKNIMKSIKNLVLEIWAAFLRLFMAREKRRYWKDKVKRLANPETKARAIHVPQAHRGSK